MWRSVQSLALHPRFLLVLYVALAVIAAVQLYLLPARHMPHGASTAMLDAQASALYDQLLVTQYNNYIIFKRSFYHLLAGKNLYTIYPTEHWDFFKYSPTFAILMAPLAVLPDLPGLITWNVINALAVLFAVRMLPFEVKTKSMLLLFVALELLTSLQNAQSNGLMCGLMIAAYGCMQHKKVLWATLWIVLAAYIKVYGAVCLCVFLFYPEKTKFILYTLLWTVVLGALPLLATPWHTLLWQYQCWLALMKADAAASYGISVAGWLHSWFNISARSGATVAGLILFIIPLLRYKLWVDTTYRMLMLAMALIWVIIFNHKAESPTYVIAMAGVAIWYFATPHALWRTVIFWLAFLFTSLGTTDIFPPYVRLHVLVPYTIKAVPCILAFCALLADVLTLRKNESVQQPAG